MDIISEGMFEEEWGAHVRPDGNFFEFDEVKDLPVNVVWTVVETGDDDNEAWFAQPGFSVVNKLGYVLTTKPWDEETPDAYWYRAD